MKTGMSPRTRLDPAVKLQEHREENSLHDLAKASRAAAEADETLRVAHARARHDHRQVGTAADWQLAEHAHTRALADVAVAERSAKTATQAVGASRSVYTTIHAKAEALRRLQLTRREDAIRAIDASERKSSEDLFLMRRAVR